MTSGASPWREPTSLLPLRWGTYHERYLAGLALITGGTLALVGSNTYIVPFLLLGTASNAAGWLILPAGGIRRAWVVWLGVAGMWLLLPGPKTVPAAILLYVSWLVVRARPWRSWISLVPALGTALVLANLYRDQRDQPLVLAIEAVALVGSAWLARALAATSSVPNSG